MGNIVEGYLSSKFNPVFGTNNKNLNKRADSKNKETSIFKWEDYGESTKKALEEKEKRTKTLSNKILNFLGGGEKLTAEEQKILKQRDQSNQFVPQMIQRDTNGPE